jgi:beta-lactamase regulating signal transducer with metallopeptidase domain
MHALLNWLWQGCVVGLALFAMLGLLDRARAKVRYLLCWAAQLLVLALPLVALIRSEGGSAVPLPRVPVAAVVSVPDAWWTSGALIAAAWLAWACLGGLRFVRAMVALRRARAQSRPFPRQVESVLAHWGQVRGRGRRPRLVVSEAVSAAAVLGCGAPMIAVAPALVTRLEVDELDRVVIHEWAHVQRRDDHLNLLQIAVRLVAGWHPAVWWIDRRLQAEREIACDEATVVITGAPKTYAACLVKLAELKSAAPALAAPAVLAASGLRARVTRIVSRNTFLAPRLSMGFAVAVVAALAVVSVAVAQTRLIEPAEVVVPSEPIRTAAVRVDRAAVVQAPAGVARQEPAPPAERKPVPVRDGAPSARVDVVPVSPTVHHAVLHAAPAPPRAVDSPAPPEAVEVAVEVRADGPAVAEPLLAPAAPAPVQSNEVTDGRVRTPWAQAADGGTAIGKASKEAGLATAGVFTRIARRVAGSF